MPHVFRLFWAQCDRSAAIAFETLLDKFHLGVGGVVFRKVFELENKSSIVWKVASCGKESGCFGEQESSLRNVTLIYVSPLAARRYSQRQVREENIFVVL